MDWIQISNADERKTVRRASVLRFALAVGLASLFSIVHAVAQEPKASDLDFAHGLYGRKEFLLAVEEYQNFLRKNPTGTLAEEARFFLAESLVQLKRPVEALESYAVLTADADAMRRNYRMALYRTGEIQFDRGDLPKATQAMRKFVAQFPGDPLLSRVNYLIAEAEFSGGRFAEAETAFAEAAKSTNAAIATNAKIGRAKALARLGRVADATASIEELMRANTATDNDRLLYSLGAMLLDAAKIESALDAFDRLLRQFPRSRYVAAARLGRGRALDKLNRADDAQAAFRDLLEESAWPNGDDGRADAWLWYGLSQLKQKKPEQAAITFRQAARLFPGNARSAEYAFYTAVADLEHGKAKDARLQFETIANEPNSPLAKRALVYAARCQLAEKDFPAVYRAYEKLANDSDSGIADQLAQLCGQAILDDTAIDGDKKFALLDRVANNVKTSETRLQLKHLFATARYSRQDYDGARRDIRSLLDGKPDNLLRAQGLYLLGLCDLKQSKWDDAAAAIEEAVDFAFDRVQGAESAGAALPNEFVGGLIGAGGQIAGAMEPGPRSKRLLEKLTREAARRADAVDLLLKLANGLHAKRRFAEARRLYDRILTLDIAASEKGRILGAVAWAEFENGEFVRAAERFRAAATATSPRSPQHVEALYMSAIAAERTLGETINDSTGVAAAAILENYLSAFRSPVDFERRTEAGLRAVRMLGRLKRPDEADKLLTDIANDKSTQGEVAAKVAYERAWLKIDRGQSEAALAEFRRLIQEYPNAAFAGEALLKAAELAFDRKQFSEAESLAGQAEVVVADRSMKEAATFRKAMAALEQRRWDVAATAFEKLTQQASAKQSATAEFWLAEIEFLRDKADSASTKFRKLLERADIGDLQPTAQLRIAQCQLALNKPDAALELASKFVAANPESPLTKEALIVQGRVLIRQAKFDEARSRLESAAIDKSEPAARAQFLIGQTYFHQQRLDDAIKAFLKVEILYPYPNWQALALLEAGKCYDQKKEPTAAKAIYGRLLEKFPDSEPAAEARRLSANAGSK